MHNAAEPVISLLDQNGQALPVELQLGLEAQFGSVGIACGLVPTGALAQRCKWKPRESAFWESPKKATIG